jgi:hypothetical protein
MKGPSEEQIRQAERTGVLVWKEIQDIEHIKNGVPDGCKCSLCEAARSVADSVSPGDVARAMRDRTPEFKVPSTCPKCGDPFPVCIDNFDVIDVLPRIAMHSLSAASSFATGRRPSSLLNLVNLSRKGRRTKAF